MSTLTICLFGHMQVRSVGEEAPLSMQRSSQALFAYLLSHPKRLMSRDQIIEAFWSERSKQSAQSCLTTALWRLRRILESANIGPEVYLITTDADEVGFNWECRYWLDVECFQESIAPILRTPIEAMEPEDAKDLVAALALYRGELLEVLYTDWALRARERMRRLYLNSLAHLMRYHAHHHEFAMSLTYGRRILELDPLREEIHRHMMRIYVEDGRRARSVRQYEICRQILDDELGLTPMEATERLYRSIVEPGPSLHKLTADSPASPTYPTISAEIEQALKHIEDARGRLDKAVELLAVIRDREEVAGPN